MTAAPHDPLDVAPGETGVLRVFALNLPRSDLRRDWGAPGTLAADPAQAAARADWAAGLLGLPRIAAEGVEVVDAGDMGGLALSDYLAEGQGVAAQALAPDRARLDALHGPVMVLASRAFAGAGVRLAPDPRLTLIGTYAEDRPPPARFDPLPAEGARGTLSGPPARPPMSPARIGGMVAMAALAVLFALTALVIWISG